MVAGQCGKAAAILTEKPVVSAVDIGVVAVVDGHVRPVFANALRLDDAIYDTGGKKVSSSYRQDAGIQTQGQQAAGEAQSSTADAGNDNRRR